MEFISISRDYISSEKVFKNLILSDVILTNTQKLDNKKNLIESSRESTIDSINTNSIITEELIKLNDDDKENNVIALESFSFGSTGNRLSQISGYQYILRYNLLEHIISIDNLYMYAPITVKSIAGAAGKNKGKDAMIEAFLNHEDKLPFLEDTKFYKNMKTNPKMFQTKTGKWCKPIDDIVDSYWILKTYFIKNKTN